jgi:hypothetical protein
LGFVQGSGVEVENHDSDTATGEPLGDGKAEAFGTTCDDGHLIAPCRRLIDCIHISLGC